MFRLSRKLARMRSIEDGRPNKSRRRRIGDIRAVPSVPVRCISVNSPSHLYLCSKGWIPTHNTEAGNCFLGFIIHQAPGPALAVQPTVELAKRNSRQRIDPLIEESPALRDKVKPARSRDAGNTMLSKEFAGGILIMTGANSAVGLRSTPARYIFLDEVDAYPASADEEGDPVSLAEARSLTFAHRRKVFLASTPTIRGLSRIEREYEASDQRRFFVACPHCGHATVAEVRAAALGEGQARDGGLRLRGLRRRDRRAPQDRDARGRRMAGDRDLGRPDHDRLPPLGALFAGRLAQLGAHRARRGRRPRGRTRRSAPSATPSSARPGSRPARRRTGAGSTTGGSAGPPAPCPKGGLILTAGADVQKDRIEVDVWAWGRGLESWLVDHVVIDGGPESAAAWSALAALLGRTWPHVLGAELPIARLAVDTGYEAPAVYAWARAQGFAQVAPVKGVEGFNRASPVSGPTYVDATVAGKRLRRGARLWTVAVSTFKAETYRFLRLVRPTGEEIAAGARMPAGTIHLPDWVESEWLKQFVAEQLVTVKTRRGFARLEWQKLRERNEALDARVYARAAAWIAGLERWSEERWAEAEREVSVERARPPQTRKVSAAGVAGFARRLAWPQARLAAIGIPCAASDPGPWRALVLAVPAAHGRAEISRRRDVWSHWKDRR